MVDLRLTPEEQKERMNDMCCSPSDMPKEVVPWGLRVELTDRELEKLGLDTVKVGSEITAHVTFKVTSYSENEVEGGKKTRCSSLAIIGMDMGEGYEDKREKAKTVLYG